MFGLVCFSDGSYGIYPVKNILQLSEIDKICTVKHKGCKYEAKLIAVDAKKDVLKRIQEEEMKKIYISAEKANVENSFIDFSFGIDYVDINRSSTSFITNFDNSVFNKNCDEHDGNFEQENNNCEQDKTDAGPSPCISGSCNENEYEAGGPSGSCDDEREYEVGESEFGDNSVDDPNYEISDSDLSEIGNVKKTDVSKSLLNTELHCNGRDLFASWNDNEKENENISNNYLSPIETCLSASLTEPGSCDDKNMVVMESRGKKGDKKANFCVIVRKNNRK
ncbi:hypothetical protein JTB14_017531 [Gonioctena quinquepunctata]|nr:hypothetical protein JTB14_017531 [Gonioctena quinquepunctata]